MVRFLLTVAVQLVAAAIGLLVAGWTVDGLTVTFGGFLLAVAVFTATTALVQPFALKMALTHARPILGATALIATFVGLLVASAVSGGLRIDGAEAWLLGTLVVWAATLASALLLPIVAVKLGVRALRAPDPT
jgi:hypothetical protein